MQGGAGADTLLITKIVSGVTYSSSSMTLAVENFFWATGDFTIRKTSATVTLSDSSSMTADVLTVGGNNVSAFVGLNGGTANELGLSLTGVNFGLALLTDQSNSTRKWTSLQASATGADFVGITGLTLNAGTVDVSINQAASGTVVVDYTPTGLTVPTSATTDVTLDMAGEDGEQLQASGDLTIAVSDFVTLTGTVGFSVSGTNLVTVGSSVTASLVAGAASVTLSNAKFGMTTDGTNTAFELKDGTFGAVISGLASITTTSVLVQYNPAATVFTATTLGVGAITYTFDADIAANTTLLAATGFNATLLGFFQMSGDVAIKKSFETVKVNDGTGDIDGM